MKIIHYPHPTLKHSSKPLKRVDRALKEMVREMFELMYAAKGVGLAANQVDLPFRLFVANPLADPIEGEEFVFINPVIKSRGGGIVVEQEGCLSLPDVWGDVKRPSNIVVNAFTLQGEEIEASLDGYLSRIVQHEIDHLDGVMFIERMNEFDRREIDGDVKLFEDEFHRRRQAGQIPSDEEIAQRLNSLELQYC